MDLKSKLIELKEKLWELQMHRTKKVYLSAEELQNKMRNNEPIPTNIYNTTETTSVVPSTTIYESKLVKKPFFRKR